MGLRLHILYLWTPKYIIRKELQNISKQTTAALLFLVSKHDVAMSNMSQEKQPKTIGEQRTTMAQTQAALVNRLERAVGHDEAVRLARQVLFSVGQSLGKQVRKNLGVNDSQDDLFKAAKILYRILGIEFHLVWQKKNSATLIIDRCVLAKEYSRLTCEVLSATDEGVISGLQPEVTMRFDEYMTSGFPKCRAIISFEGRM